MLGCYTYPFPIWRSLVAMTLTDDVAAVLDGRNFAHVTTLDPDGTPQASVMWVTRDDDHIILNTARGRRKWHNLRNDPRVAISISPAGDPYRNFSIAGRVVEMRTRDGREVIDRLSEKYTGNPVYQNMKPGMVRVTIVVEPTRVASWG